MMEKEKYNERISRIIWHDVLQSSIRPLSWGIDLRSIKVIENGTEFDFHNCNTRGKVRIRYSESTGLFNVTLIQDDNRIIMENVEKGILVSVIDKNLGCHVLVEHGVAV